MNLVAVLGGNHDYRLMALSIVPAILVSYAALDLAERVIPAPGQARRFWLGITIAAISIGAWGMHYLRMLALRQPEIASALTHAIGISTADIVAICMNTSWVFVAAVASSVFRRCTVMRKVDLSIRRERELYFQTMAEAVPEIVWTATPEGQDDYFNQRLFDYTGLALEQLRGMGWTTTVHPDDLELCASKWKSALRTGEPYDVQYRLRGKDGSYRWFLCRGNPIRNAEGTIVKWLGTCTDIESQKLNEQILEGQILERTLQLADANARLQEEMSAKDSARQELDQQTERMMGELEKRSDRATMLAELGELLQSCISREEVIAAALGFAPKIFPHSRGAVMLLNASRSLVEVIGSWTDCQLSATEFESSECWALRTGHPHKVEAGDSTARCAHARDVRCSYLCLPILAQGETLGILHLQVMQEGAQLDPAELSFRTTFAGQVGLSIANIKLRDALRTQSVRDALTGLYNRRYLEETLEREVRRATRAHQCLGLLMIDLDHFKAFNDTYGHDAGDAVLRETAASLIKGVRAEDFVCRFGGEEFVVILPTASLENAWARAETLRLKIRELAILHQGKSMGMVTISVGVASFPQHGKSPQELMAAADAALYDAKRGGRDRVATATQVLKPAPIPAAAKAGI